MANFGGQSLNVARLDTKSIGVGAILLVKREALSEVCKNLLLQRQMYVGPGACLNYSYTGLEQYTVNTT